MRRLRCVPGLCIFNVPYQHWQGKSQLMCTKRPVYWESWATIKFAKKLSPTPYYSHVLKTWGWRSKKYIVCQFFRQAVCCIARTLRRSQDWICSRKKSPILQTFLRNCPSEFRFTVFFPGDVGGFINPPLQPLVNQHFSQTIKRLFSKKKY